MEKEQLEYLSHRVANDPRFIELINTSFFREKYKNEIRPTDTDVTIAENIITQAFSSAHSYTYSAQFDKNNEQLINHVVNALYADIYLNKIFKKIPETIEDFSGNKFNTKKRHNNSLPIIIYFDIINNHKTKYTTIDIYATNLNQNFEDITITVDVSDYSNLVSCIKLIRSIKDFSLRSLEYFITNHLEWDD